MKPRIPAGRGLGRNISGNQLASRKKKRLGHRSEKEVA